MKPRRCPIALLLVDVINDFDFPAGDRLASRALIAARRLAEVKKRFAKVGAPTIYANDNFGRWRSQFTEQVAHCAEASEKGGQIVNLLRPEPADYFVLKPKHSGFNYTCLDLLLRQLGIETLVIGGFATDICVSFTAHDAHQHDYSIVVVTDGCAAQSPQRHSRALLQLRETLDVRLLRASQVRIRRRRNGKVGLVGV